MRQEIQLDALVDPFEARLDIYRDDTGALRKVAFDLSGLPRIDAMLVGKHATEVPGLVLLQSWGSRKTGVK